MRPPKLFRSKHYVAVVGLYRSGKTVFITSFINHVLHHRPADLKLGNGGVQLTFDEELRPVNGFIRFPYEKYRCENNGRWPLKTNLLYQYRCSFFRSDWTWTKGQLALIDIPGERLADIPMSKLSFAQWSDWLLERVFQDQHYRNLSQIFLSAINRDGVGESEITLAYRRLLAELYKSYRPVITPSTFLLNDEGEFSGAALIRGDISGSFVGLNEDEQFAPLPANVRQKDMALTNGFASRYEKYRRKLAVPLTRTISRCNELAILIDPTTLLAANTGMYNGNRALLDQLFQILSPGKGIFGVGMDLLRKSFGGHWGQSGISKIAIVATKADKVHDSQRDKLTELVKDMAEGVVNKFKLKSMQLDCKFFGCAAVKSTTSVSNGQLRGHLPGEEGFAEYEVSELPSKWPGKW
ncbi:MAG: YcjX family protein, partial [Betaproteobacteria bacterium]|nr:YcjX family protein [Betaproteobacteria bacterium]